MKNYGVAQGTAANLSTPYTAPIVADANQTQLNARGAFRDISNNNVGAAPLNSAIDSTSGFLNFKPTQVASSFNPTTFNPATFNPTTYNPINISAGQVSDADLAKYMSPFTSGVINTTMADLERQRQIAGVNDNQRATASHAFGGSRQGVADSLTNESYDRTGATTLAGLRQSAFTNAQDQATADINRRLTADTANQGAAYNAAALNTGNAYNAAALNTGNAYSAAALNQTGAFNAADMALRAATANQGADISGANIRLGAGTNLANYSTQQLAQAGQRAGFMAQAGDAEQAQQQAELTAQYNEFIRQLTGSAQGQQLLNQALGAFPNQSTTTQTQSGGGLGGLFGAVGAIGGGLLGTPAAGKAIFG